MNDKPLRNDFFNHWDHFKLYSGYIIMAHMDLHAKFKGFSTHIRIVNLCKANRNMTGKIKYMSIRVVSSCLQP